MADEDKGVKWNRTLYIIIAIILFLGLLLIIWKLLKFASP
jgi:hypothetical protein